MRGIRHLLPAAPLARRDAPLQRLAAVVGLGKLTSSGRIWTVAILLAAWTVAHSETPADSLGAATPGKVAPAAAPVFVVSLADAIGPASARFLIEGIDGAEKERAACLVVELDTPGGLDSAMRDIVKRILAADVPVVIYVAPSGSRAASAGLFILLAAHVAAMAPGTNTGAAHPVQMGGGAVDSIMSEKVENDAASFIRSLAQKRRRNAEWAERAVRAQRLGLGPGGPRARHRRHGRAQLASLAPPSRRPPGRTALRPADTADEGGGDTDAAHGLA